MQPIDYSTQQIANPMASYLQGLKYGQEVKAVQENQKLLEKQKLFQQDLIQLQQNPTGNGMLNLMMQYPEFAKTLEPIQKVYSSAEKQSELSNFMQVDNALINGNGDLALKVLEKQKQALTNAKEDTTQLDMLTDLINKGDIKGAQGVTGAQLASVLGDKYKSYQEGQTERLMQSSKVKEAEGKAKGEELKNTATATGQKQSALMTGLVDASTALLQNNKDAALNTLMTEKTNAVNLGMPTAHYDKAIEQINNGDLIGAKRTVDTIGLGVYGKDWKDVIAGQTNIATQPSTVSKAQSEAKEAKVKADYAPTLAKLEVELKNLDKQNKVLDAQKTKTQIKSEQVGITVKQQELQTKKLEHVGKMNEIGGKMNENAQIAKVGYDSIDATLDVTKGLKKDLEVEKGKKFPSTGTIMGRLPIVTDVSKKISNDIANAKNGVTLLQAQIHKGELTPMSDTDVAILEKASNNLDEHNSPEENIRQLGIINTLLNNHKKSIKSKTGYDQFQADKYKPYVPKSVTGSGKAKPDPLGLFK